MVRCFNVLLLIFCCCLFLVALEVVTAMADAVAAEVDRLVVMLTLEGTLLSPWLGMGGFVHPAVCLRSLVVDTIAV